MMNLKYFELLRENNALSLKKLGRPYNIAVLSNIIVSQFKEIFEYSLRIVGINANVELGDYDNIVQDSSKYKKSNLIIVFWELSNLINGFQYKANLMTRGELNDVIQKTKSEIDFVFANLQENSLVIVNRFSSLLFNSTYLSDDNLDIACAELNSHLDKCDSPNIIILDIDKVIAKVSVDKSVDWRSYYSSKVLYTIAFFKEYASYVRAIPMSAEGKAKKALIFDCDNTLWKGIVGESGVNGVAMSSTLPGGDFFEEAQAIACDLNNKGVLIGICSKNNPEDVDEVINRRTDMLIGEDRIAIKKVNWNDKITNLIEIAEELNIGLDSMVFVDDSAFEVNFVREGLPQVAVYQVPERGFDYPHRMRELGALFYNMLATKEDRSKNEQYKQQVHRESEKKRFGSLEEYLSELKLFVKIKSDDEQHIARLSQLTQKTNQFNLTTIRYTVQDILSFIRSKDALIFSFSVSDKFGDYGLAGEAILEFNSDMKSAHINSFLMSCRVIGRNIEYVFFDFLFDYLQKLKIEKITTSYVRTPKNHQVSNFYDSLGFRVSSISENLVEYIVEPGSHIQSKIDYIEVIYGE